MCGASDSSSLSLPITFTTPPVNDLPVNAIPLIVNDTCIGALYSNTGASHMVNEPVGDCIGSAGYKSVWFSFTAPPSGFVRIRKPVNNVQGELINARISLYSTTNPAGLSGFNIISCDYKEPTGPSLGLTMYANDLIPGYTYYIAVDVLNAGTSPGRFCLTVYDVDSTMLPTSGNCVTGVNKVNVNSIYTGGICGRVQ